MVNIVSHHKLRKGQPHEAVANRFLLDKNSLAEILGVLILLPPIWITLKCIANLIQSPPTTASGYLWMVFIVFLRLFASSQQTIDTIWRLIYVRRPKQQNVRNDQPNHKPLSNGQPKRDGACNGQPRHAFSNGHPLPPRSLHQEDGTPLVDIIITTCREDPEMIMDTIVAACNIDYPNTRYRIVVADDGQDMKLRSKVVALHLKYENLFYFARDKPQRVELNPKAHNINNTLEWVQQSNVLGKSDFVAVLDCDMMPEPEFLVVLLSYMIEDPRIAMAVPPQNYYNIPVNDPLYQSMDVQNKLDEPARNRFGGAWCAGSGFLARHVAIDSIGGFPDESLCEDILCGFKLNGQGWRVVFVDQALQWGLMPDSIEAHIAQRRRWAVGSVQNAKALKFCFGRRVRSMSIAQRLAGFSYCFNPFGQYILQPVTLLLLPWSFAFGMSRVFYPDHEALKSLLFWNLVSQVIAFSKCQVEATFAPRHTLLQREFGQYWLRGIVAASVFTEALPKRLKFASRIGRLPFISSGSIKSDLAERSRHARPPLTRRLKIILLDRRYIANTILAVNAVSSFAVVLLNDLRQIRGSGSSPKMVLLSNSLSPVVEWQGQLSFFIPIIYAMFPPDVPQRRSMMKLDSDGVWRVQEGYRKVRQDGWGLLLELQAYASLVWGLVTFLWINCEVQR